HPTGVLAGFVSLPPSLSRTVSRIEYTPALENEQALLASSPTTSDCAVTPLPQSSDAVCVSTVPGSVKLDETGTVTPPGVRPSGVAGMEKAASDGATFEIVAVVRAVS